LSASVPVTPGSIQVPGAPDAPVIVDFGVHALRAALVRKESVPELAQTWAAPGVYCLLGALGGEGKTTTYVGKGVSVRKRLMQHRAKPPIEWWRAVAIVRDTTDGFNSAEIGYLEGRLAKEVEGFPNVELKAEKYDLDTTLPAHLLIQLDTLVPTILSALRVAGLDVRKGIDGQETSSITRKTVPGTVSDLLSEGLLSAGTKLTFKRGSKLAHATVTAAGDLVVDGKSYSSPSTAAAAALNLKAANGWTSWRLDDGSGPTLAELRSQLPTKS
jgi:Restriction Enzyme Adenine Methylase Associated